MEIEFQEDGIELLTEGILESLYVDRLGLKKVGDTCKCLVTFKGSYLALKVMKEE